MADEKDIKILRELKKDGKLSAQDISRRTGLAATTVFNRIKRMEKTGLIKGYTAVIDEGRIGRNVAAYVLITVDYGYLKRKKIQQQELAAAIRKNEFVDEVSMVTGSSDIVVKIRTQDVRQLNDFVTRYLRNVDGVEKTQTSVILESF